MPPFSDLSLSHLLKLMLARYSSSHQTLHAFDYIFSSIASHRILTAFQLATTRKKKVISFYTFSFSFSVLIMVLLKLKNLDGVALCLLCLLVCDFCLTIRGFATCYLFFFFLLVSMCYVCSFTFPFLLFLLLFSFFFSRLLLTFVSFFSFLFIHLVCPWPRWEHQENH